MFKIIYTPKVKNDLIDIQEYIAKDSVFYALNVIQKIIDTINILSTFPKIWAKIDNIHHMIIDKNYWYKIIYKISKEKIIIMWVFKYKKSWKN